MSKYLTYRIREIESVDLHIDETDFEVELAEMSVLKLVPVIKSQEDLEYAKVLHGKIDVSLSGEDVTVRVNGQDVGIQNRDYGKVVFAKNVVSFDGTNAISRVSFGDIKAGEVVRVGIRTNAEVAEQIEKANNGIRTARLSRNDVPDTTSLKSRWEAADDEEAVF